MIRKAVFVAVLLCAVCVGCQIDKYYELIPTGEVLE